MSDLETLKRKHPEWKKWPHKCFEFCVALQELIQQHEAELAKAQETIAERTSQRDECGRLAAEEGVKVFNLRSDLATAEAELAKREAQLAEVDRAIIEVETKDDAFFKADLVGVVLSRERARSKVRGSEETK